MSAPTIEAPPSKPATPARPRKRRRLRILLLSMTVVIAAGTGIFLASDRPLIPGPLVAGDSAQGPVYVAGGQGRDRVVYLPGATVQWGYSIRNDGILPVTVTNVEPISGSLFSSSSVLISTCDLATAGCNAFPGPLEPFRAFSLGVGQQRTLLYRAVFANCGQLSARSNTIAFSGFTVTYQAFGVSRTVPIDGWRHAALRVDVPSGC